MDTAPLFYTIPELQAREFMQLNFEAATIGDISDGYHTFNELYEHRCLLFALLCKYYEIYCNEFGYEGRPWISEAHHDGSKWEGWFIAGLTLPTGKVITYHLPSKLWDSMIHYCEIKERAPEWDGHTSDDVVLRMCEFLNNKNYR